MSALADTLRRAAAFLDALPEDIRPPTIRQTSADMFSVEWHWSTSKSVWILLTANDAAYQQQFGSAIYGDNFTFDGEGVTVPPEVLAAIRRVSGGGE